MADQDKTAAFPSPSSSHNLFPSTAGWAIFLGVSWTWCIGMFLPVLLMRDLGIGGFVVFAIPNIVGAAAMGWVLRDAEQSRQMVQQHESACVAFSLVTIVFHAFFAAWLIQQLIGPVAGVAMAVVFCVFWIILQWRRGGPFFAAALALLTSLIVMAWGMSRGDLPYIAHPIAGNMLPAINILWLTPACIFGFALCPYLDLTFHAARQATTAPQARAAFSLGFGAVFALMILFTVGYSGWLVAAFDRARYPTLGLILAAHLIVQSCFTVAAHARQLADRTRRIRISRFLAFGAALVIAVLLGSIDRGETDFYHGLHLGEVIYRCFLGFYALAFPAYVWLCIVPPRRSLLRLITIVVIAAPLFWLAFIEQKMIWLVPGVLIPLASKFLPATEEVRMSPSSQRPGSIPG